MRGWRWERAKESLSEELEAHLRMAVAERVARGEDPARAREAALRELGNVGLIEDVTRARWGWVWLENLLRDARLALRQLRRAPAFAVTVLLTLGLAIGANLGVFQLLYAVILADLPAPHPEELVAVHALPTPFDHEWLVSSRAYERMRAATGENLLAARVPAGVAELDEPGRPVTKTECELVSDNYFSVLGVKTAAGRLFVEADGAQRQGEYPAVLRFDYARDVFGSVEGAVGRRVRLNGIPIVVVGVTQRRFLGEVTGYAPDAWLPLAAQSTGAFGVGWDSLGPGHDVELGKPWYRQPGIFWLMLEARVPRGQRAGVLARWEQGFGEDRGVMLEATADPAARAALLRTRMEMVALHEGAVRQRFATALLLLMGLSGSLYLVGCLNLANLQLGRLAARGQELGVRMALGASRTRLLGQVMIEDALLVILGGGLAFGIGEMSSKLLVRWASNRNAPLRLDLHPALPLAAVGVGLTVVALLAFSGLPAGYFMRRGVAQAAGSRARVAGVVQTARQRWRSNALLGAQVSLSLVLSTMSACFAGTLVHWETADVGMDREHVLSVHVDLDEKRYTDRLERLPGLYRQIGERLRAVPGVRSAAVGMCGSIHCGWRTALYVHGRSGLTDGQVHGEEDHVGPGFFATVGIPILRGRDFSRADDEKTQAVAIVSRSYARQLFGDADPVGQWVGYEPGAGDRKFLVIGEVGDAHWRGPQSEAPPMVYMSLDQKPAPAHLIRVRTMGDPRGVAESVRQALHEMDPLLPVTEVAAFDTELNGDLSTQRLLARLAGVYAGLTLVLVAIGFYGVMASRTARRRGEFGIRLALGATRRQIERLVLGQTGRILLAGLVPGAVLSAMAVRAAGHFVYGSAGGSVAAVMSAGVVLGAAGWAAAWIPARRAAGADPVETLRGD